jgi:transposase
VTFRCYGPLNDLLPIERPFAWLQNYRRIVVRYERYPEYFLGVLHLACWLILLRVFMG